MEVGLAQLLEMFERRLGPRLTSALVYLIAAGVAAIMFGAIYDHAARPLYDFVVLIFGPEALGGVPPLILNRAIEIILISVLGGVFGLFLGIVAGRIITRRSRKRAATMLDKAAAMLKRAQTEAEQWKDHIEEGKKIRADLEGLVKELRPKS